MEEEYSSTLDRQRKVSSRIMDLYHTYYYDEMEPLDFYCLENFDFISEEILEKSNYSSLEQIKKDAHYYRNFLYNAPYRFPWQGNDTQFKGGNYGGRDWEWEDLANFSSDTTIPIVWFLCDETIHEMMIFWDKKELNQCDVILGKKEKEILNICSLLLKEVKEYKNFGYVSLLKEALATYKKGNLAASQTLSSSLSTSIADTISRRWVELSKQGIVNKKEAEKIGGFLLPFNYKKDKIKEYDDDLVFAPVKGVFRETRGKNPIIYSRNETIHNINITHISKINSLKSLMFAISLYLYLGVREEKPGIFKARFKDKIKKQQKRQLDKHFKETQGVTFNQFMKNLPR